MERECPVDVISVCSAAGEIRPLRFRMEDDTQQMIKVDVEQIISTKTVPYVGIESQIFFCRGTVAGRTRLFALKYMIRNHSWRLCQNLP